MEDPTTTSATHGCPEFIYEDKVHKTCNTLYSFDHTCCRCRSTTEASVAICEDREYSSSSIFYRASNLKRTFVVEQLFVFLRFTSHSRMLEIPPPLSFGRVGRLYNTTLLKIYTTIYDPICHRDIRPLELSSIELVIISSPP
jgi:hypothetical protein